MRYSVLMAVFILAAASNIWAEEEKKPAVKYNLGEILVSATKTETHQAEVGSSTTVITAQDIEKTGKGTVQEILRGIPGVSVMQNGAFGGTSSVYLRGSKPGHTLVLIDGIEINDPMKSDRSFDFAHLTTNDIERIEVVRGPQSTLYGSDAIGGVINIITKKGKGKPKWQLSFEGGSYNTFKETLGVSGSQDKLDYSLSLLRLDSEGVSKAADGSEDDEYENITLSNRLGYEISEDTNLDFVFRFTDAKYDYDDGAYRDDSDKVGWWRNIMGKAAFDQAINSIWGHNFSFSYSQTRRKYKDDPDATDSQGAGITHNWFKGDMKKVEWQHNIEPVDWSTLTCGFEYEKERGFGDGRVSSDRLDRKSIDNTAGYLQNQFKLWENLFFTPGLRVDDHELFGTEITHKLSVAYIIPQTETRLKANWGTGFKAPSLYQLFHPTYGNDELNPDESKSYDCGFEQYFWNDKISFDLTYFHNDFKNMVDWDSDTLSYKNIDNAKTEGLEFGCSFRPMEEVTIGANYTYTKTKDNDTGLKLRRRPKHEVGLDINLAFLDRGNVNLSADYIGFRWSDENNTQKLKQYIKTDLCAYYDLTEAFQIFGRIENLFDKKFQQIRGYAEPGRSFYGGGKLTF